MRTVVASSLALLIAIAGVVSAGAQQPGQIVKPAPARPAAPREPQPQKGTSVIRGHLLDALTGNPIRRARVLTSGPATNPATVTDAEGRFELRDLPAGRYMLNATKSGYLSLSVSNGGKPLPPLVVGEDETIDKVVLRLTRGGVIAGHVVDELGEPLPNVEMRALRYRYVDGRRELSEWGNATSVATDDLGGYRIYGLEPGDYFVSARPRNDFMSAASPHGGEGPALTYYPGTASANEARRVTVRGGRETQGVTFATAVTRLARIRGRAVMSNGEPLVNGGVTLAQRTGVGGTMSTGVGVRPDGTFEIANLPPGTYLLTTRLNYVRDDDPGETGRLLVSLNGEDLNDVLLVGVTGGTARGRFVTDDGVPLPFPGNAMMINVGPMDPNVPYSGRTPTKIQDDGTFEIKGLFDRMHLRSGVRLTPGMSPGGTWTFKSILLEGQDVTDRGIEFRPGQTVENIEIVYTRKTSYLSGTVHTDQGAVSNTWVVAFPAEESRWTAQSRFIRAAMTGGKGQYRLQLTPSDDYLVVAVTGLENGQWFDPEFLRSVRDLATRVSIGEGETKVQDVKIVEWRK